MERESLNTSIPSPHFQSRSGMLNHTGGTYSHSGMMDDPRIPMTEWNLWNFLTLWIFKAGQSTSDLRFGYEQPVLRSQCTGSEKLRLPNQWKNFWHRDRLQDSTIFLTSIWLLRWLRQPWRSFSTRSQISERVSVEEQRAQKHDRFLRGRQIAYISWLMSISVQPELMMQYKDSHLCSLLVYRMMMFKISTSDGIKLC